MCNRMPISPSVRKSPSSNNNKKVDHVAVRGVAGRRAAVGYVVTGFVPIAVGNVVVDAVDAGGGDVGGVADGDIIVGSAANLGFVVGGDGAAVDGAYCR